MLTELTEIEDSGIPKSLTDDKMIRLGQEFAREFLAYSRPRLSLEMEIWPACDRAMMCVRDDMPFIPTMRFVDNGMLGESDIRDAIKTARNQILSGIIPSDESWLEPAMGDGDDEAVLRKIKDLLIAKFEGADIRTKCQIFVDQLLGRGTSGLGLRWTKRRQVKTISRKLAKQLNMVADDLQLTDDEGTPLTESRKSLRYWETIYNGPEIFPIDMYRLYLDPAQELGKDTEPSYIYMTFKTMTDLKNARDEETGDYLYDRDVLKNVKEWTYKDYYTLSPWACSSTRLMGIDPSLENMGKFVPVYMFYQQIRHTEDDDIYVDKIFYVARDANKSEWKIIRVQDNPSANGDKPFYVVNCDSWLNVPYGTGLAEKSLSAWKAKNVMAAIALNAMILQIFPPMYYAGNVIKDDRKPKMMPGAFQEIVMRPNIGLDWIKPYPINPNNVEISMQEQKYLAEKILSQTGAQTSGLVTDPSKSMSKSKTATEIKQEAVEGTSAQQVIVDKINNQVMEPLAQGMYNLIKENGMDGQTTFEGVNEAGRAVSTTLTPEELGKDRTIKIIGRRGLANKGQRLANLENIMKILTMPAAAQTINNLPVILQDVLFELIQGNGLPMKPEYRIPTQELFAKDPQIQMQAMQMAIQNPQMREKVIQTLANSPEGQEFIAKLQADMAKNIDAETRLKDAILKQQEMAAMPDPQVEPAPARPAPGQPGM